MARLAEVLEVLCGVANNALVERAEVGGRKAKGVRAGEVMEIPVNELPIESVVVGDEHGATDGMLRQPSLELAHDGLGIGKRQRLLASKATDCERAGNPAFGNGANFAVECLGERRIYNHGAETNH